METSLRLAESRIKMWMLEQQAVSFQGSSELALNRDTVYETSILDMSNFPEFVVVNEN